MSGGIDVGIDLDADKKTEYRKSIIKDFITNALEPVLFELCASHIKLTKAEYKRNPEFNNEHFSYIAEEKIGKFMLQYDMFDNFIKWTEANG